MVALWRWQERHLEIPQSESRLLRDTLCVVSLPAKEQLVEQKTYSARNPVSLIALSLWSDLNSVTLVALGN